MIPTILVRLAFVPLILVMAAMTMSVTSCAPTIQPISLEPPIEGVVRPTWQVGDSWTYRVTDEHGGVLGEYTSALDRIEPFRGVMGAYFVEREVISGRVERIAFARFVVYDENFNEIGYIDEVGVVIAEITGMRIWSWPLVVGNSWNFNGTHIAPASGRRTAISGRVNVKAYEEVTVPAGRFNAFRVVLELENPQAEGQFGWTAEYWFAPDVGNLVKSMRFTPAGFSIEKLLSYTRGGAR